MTNEETLRLISQRTGIDFAKVENLMSALPDVIKFYAKELDSVAIPGFGTFQTIKTDETLSKDLSTGNMIMLPPSIKLQFNPSVVLRKRFVG